MSKDLVIREDRYIVPGSEGLPQPLSRPSIHYLGKALGHNFLLARAGYPRLATKESLRYGRDLGATDEQILEVFEETFPIIRRRLIERIRENLILFFRF